MDPLPPKLSSPSRHGSAGGLEAPAWITESLIALTIEVWQPYYATPLSRADAIAMIIDVGRLMQAVARERSP